MRFSDFDAEDSSIASVALIDGQKVAAYIYREYNETTRRMMYRVYDTHGKEILPMRASLHEQKRKLKDMEYDLSLGIGAHMLNEHTRPKPRRRRIERKLRTLGRGTRSYGR
ncbi:MAG TPA: hypothetical protein VFU15_09555 [Bacteroidia bacterium]|nr:hypothetical protein [Bacteroidia bacterium]